MHSVYNCFGNVENIKHNFRWRVLRWLVEIGFTCQSTFGTWSKASFLIPLKFPFAEGRFRGSKSSCRGPVFLPRINIQALDLMICQFCESLILHAAVESRIPRLKESLSPPLHFIITISVSHNPAWILSFINILHTAKAMLHPRGEYFNSGRRNCSILWPF